MGICECKDVDITKEAIRLGRAHYICPKCRNDVTIMLVLMYGAEIEAEQIRQIKKFERQKKIAKKKAKIKK